MEKNSVDSMKCFKLLSGNIEIEISEGVYRKWKGRAYIVKKVKDVIFDENHPTLPEMIEPLLIRDLIGEVYQDEKRRIPGALRVLILEFLNPDLASIKGRILEKRILVTPYMVGSLKYPSSKTLIEEEEKGRELKLTYEARLLAGSLGIRHETIAKVYGACSVSLEGSAYLKRISTI